jgi:hypothetical protein
MYSFTNQNHDVMFGEELREQLLSFDLAAQISHIELTCGWTTWGVFSMFSALQNRDMQKPGKRWH